MSVPACPTCGAAQPDGGDFCSNAACRAYLAWEVRHSVPHQEPAPTTKVAAIAPQRATAVIALPDEDAQEKPLKVKAGGQVAFRALVRNQSDIVDSYKLAVEGLLAEQWWTIEPAAVHLLPLDTGERYEEEVKVLLHPPREYEATAECWPIQITARSVARDAQAASVSARLEIAPFEDIAIALDAPPPAGRLRSALRLKLTNSSNHPVNVALSGADEKQRCRVSFEHEHEHVSHGRRSSRQMSFTVNLDPGQSRLLGVTVKPHQQLLIARPLDHKLTFTASIVAAGTDGSGSADKPPSCTATYTQRSWLPWWISIVLGALFALLIAGAVYWLKLRSERIAVPNVRGTYISEARAEVNAAGLDAKERLEVTTATSIPTGQPNHANAQVEVGDVVREVPEYGTPLAPGSEVKLYAAIRPYSEPAPVPDLYDLSSTAAETRLSAAGFAIGNIQPYPPPKGQLIVRQSPRAGTVAWRNKTVVDVTLGQLAVVPAVFGQSPAAAAQKLSAVGFVIGTITPHHSRPSEVVAVQTPSANTVLQAGSSVDVRLGEVVPKLTGLAPLQARRALAGAGFARPRVTPSLASSKYVIVSQSPAAGSVVLESTHVRLVATPRPKPKPKHKAKAHSKTNAAHEAPANPDTASGSSTAATAAATLGAVAAPTPTPTPTPRPAPPPTHMPTSTSAPTRGAGEEVKPELCPGRRTRRPRCPEAPRRWAR